jgi:hypothetical protein
MMVCAPVWLWLTLGREVSDKSVCIQRVSGNVRRVR